MAHGMLTGDGFANKHKLADYIIGSKTDYFNARKDGEWRRCGVVSADCRHRQTVLKRC